MRRRRRGKERLIERFGVRKGGEEEEVRGDKMSGKRGDSTAEVHFPHPSGSSPCGYIDF